MLYEIKNDKLSISADTFGAELHSIKLDGKEYLWQCGDAWKRYAPILFPFICSPKDRTYKAGGQEYHMAANHGFARDSEFTYAGSTKNSVSFLLKDNDVTLAQYPYHFELEVTYSIKGSKVTVTNTVKNTDEKAMYFYLGGHPAFICDIQGGKCTVEYEKNEHIVQPIPNGERTILVFSPSRIVLSQLSTRKTSISFSLSQTARGLSLTVKRLSLSQESFSTMTLS